MTSDEIRKRFIEFFKSSPRNHAEIKPSPLVLPDDPTTLFTSSGMQQLVAYLTGKPHPKGKRLVDSQPCFRSVDIEEVGDNQHTTFFEMLGNWSLGDYFKEKQLVWFWEFLVKELKLPKEKLYVTVFKGTKDVPKDEESVRTWKKLGVPKEKIFYYGVKENWWSKSGIPEKMPPGEIGGPDSEVFFEFTKIKHDPKFGKECHPNCQCGRFLEIGNSVFIQYKKRKDGSLRELSQKNVDFGGGLERLAAAVNDNPDVFQIDLFKGARSKLEGVDPAINEDSQKAIRIILDHIRAAIFLVGSGVTPSNKQQGYVLRRLIRRAALYSKMANIDLNSNLPLIIPEFKKVYKNSYREIFGSKNKSGEVIPEELQKFEKTLSLGLKKILSEKSISGEKLFDIYQTYGYPPELVEEVARQNNIKVKREGYEEAEKEHREKSRLGAEKKFKKKR